MEWKDLAGALWGELNQGAPYDWPLTPADNEELFAALAPLLPPESMRRLHHMDSAHDANLRLRDLVGPYLIDAGDERRSAFARWVIGSWGGINRNLDAVDGWLQALDAFDAGAINHFAAMQFPRRVASWSKLVAFAKPLNFAIYDSRTAVALNIALRAIGCQRRFYMPASRVAATQRAAQLLRADRAGAYLVYEDYMNALRALAPYSEAKTILGAEMTAFANSRILINRLLADRSLEKGERSAPLPMHG